MQLTYLLQISGFHYHLNDIGSQTGAANGIGDVYLAFG